MQASKSTGAAPDLAVDPYQSLTRLVERYKTDVHRLASGSSEAALRSTEQHLGHSLPYTLAGFLRRWNGAQLFRGALRIRSVSELARVGKGLEHLIAFADGPGERQWAYAPDGFGGWVFGEVVGSKLVPLHDRFQRWLVPTLQMMDEGAFDPGLERALRERLDPMSAHLVMHQAEELNRSGRTDEAIDAYKRAASLDPGLVRSWQRLGQLQRGLDSTQARFCLLKAMRATRLPLPFTGAEILDVSIFSDLSSLLGEDWEVWEEELATFLSEGVIDVRREEESHLHEAAALCLVQSKLRRGCRREAVEVCAQELARAQSFERPSRLPNLLLRLVEVESELGEHDEAERHLRELLKAEGEIRARALLALGRIAVWRQERWAEEVLAEALRGLKNDYNRACCHLLLAQRCLLHEKTEEARDHLDRARSLALEGGDIGLQAKCRIAEGDLFRMEDQYESAQAAWKNAREMAVSAGEEEVLLRLLIRRGDLHAMAGRLEDAQADYTTAAQGYRKLQLPIREGWALLRLGRMGANSEVLNAARACFMACDLAAGVAAVDAVARDPQHSLDWHLARSSEHARRRWEAQRARPPLTRADADRPERRIGAHRMAIAAGGQEVVAALGNEMTRRAREMEASSGRALDPSVASYIAAADLLASHRSFEAADFLLNQVMHQKLPELPTRALRGAVTRSPNAALVDGLLQAIEAPGENQGLAAAVEIMGWRRERAALPALLRLLEREQSPRVRKSVVAALGRIGDSRAQDVLLDHIGDPHLGEAVAVALLLLGDRRGVDYHAQCLAAGTDLDAAPGEIVGRYGGPSYLLLLRGTAEGQGAKALGALQGLGYLGDPRGVTTLLGAMGRRDRAMTTVAAGALEMITGHREDLDQPGLHALWEKYWEDHETRFQDGVRYRDGRLMDLDLLVDKLGDDDGLVRRGAYDELVISTGANLPFDADGPWRVQVNHRTGWRRWVKAHRESFGRGRWWFHGQSIG
ncbi:MAG: tetratricopeptide repeat protein [Myxococcota bacterium]|nr:tetratricopeptide repeat protein [Myxococcota bacterium]